MKGLNNMTRYTMPARSQGKLYAQRAAAHLVEKDVHRWLIQRLDNFYCDLQVMYMPRFTGPVMARTCLCAGGRSASMTWGA